MTLTGDVQKKRGSVGIRGQASTAFCLSNLCATETSH